MRVPKGSTWPYFSGKKKKRERGDGVVCTGTFSERKEKKKKEEKKKTSASKAVREQGEKKTKKMSPHSFIGKNLADRIRKRGRKKGEEEPSIPSHEGSIPSCVKGKERGGGGEPKKEKKKKGWEWSSKHWRKGKRERKYMARVQLDDGV